MGEGEYRNGEQVIERWDDVFRALSAEPRRQLIVALLDRPDGESVPLPESAINPNVPGDPEAIRTRLHHQHLPMLADVGFVTYETDPFVAARGPRFDEVGIVIETLQAQATEFPDTLVVGCQRLEEEREFETEAY